MRIYPAIDIKDGKCVRLFKGRFSEVTVFNSDPAKTAREWEALGGEFIHAVDLDGALKGRGVNEEIIRRICSSVSIPVQTGGGIRNEEDIISRLDCGVNRVIIGTKAVADMEFIRDMVKRYGDKIVIGIDAKDGKVAVEGWEKMSDFTAVEFALKMQDLGVKTIVYTDIATDGTLKGPNISAMAEMVEKTSLDIIASGGVGDISHILALKKTGVEGVIIGRALYTGGVNLKEAVEAAK